MKVIKKSSKDQKNTLKDKCDNCGSVLVVNESDIRAVYDNGGGMDSALFFAGWYFRYTCPVCGDTQSINLHGHDAMAKRIIEKYEAIQKKKPFWEKLFGM